MKYFPELPLIHPALLFVQGDRKSLPDSPETPIFAFETEKTVSKMKNIFTIIQVIAVALIRGDLKVSVYTI